MRHNTKAYHREEYRISRHSVLEQEKGNRQAEQHNRVHPAMISLHLTSRLYDSRDGIVHRHTYYIYDNETGKEHHILRHFTEPYIQNSLHLGNHRYGYAYQYVKDKFVSYIKQPAHILKVPFRITFHHRRTERQNNRIAQHGKRIVNLQGYAESSIQQRPEE